MNFIVDAGLLLIGGAVLYVGAEWLVKGSAGLARAFGVRELVIGLTVIAYGTSAPELAVSTAAIIRGSSPFVLGNVIGSCIANLALVLGLTALVRPPLVEANLIRKELPWLMASVIALGVVLVDGTITRLEAAILLSLALTFTILTLLSAKRKRSEQDTEIRRISKKGKLRLIGYTVFGLAFLVTGGELFVGGAQGLALAFGVSERVVGLTVVALGTSLPELAACLIAAIRQHESLAVGNIIGSNVFNIFLILGVIGLIQPIEGVLGVTSDRLLGELQFDMIFLVAITMFGVIAMRTQRTISRPEGGLLFASYLLFVILLGFGN